MKFTIALAALCLAPAAVAQTAPPAAPQPPSRGKLIETWAHEHLAEVKAAVAAAGSAAMAAHIRAAATSLAPLEDAEISDLLVGAADGFLGEGDNMMGLATGRAAYAWAVEKKLGPGYQFDALGRSGAAQYFMVDFDGAIKDMGESVVQAKLIEPFNGNDVANAMSNYAVVLDATGRYREAVTVFEEAIALRLAAAEYRPEGTAVTYSSLAAVLKRLGRYDQAEAKYRKSIEIAEKAGLTGGLKYQRMLHNYAVFVSDQGRDAEAVAIYRKALAIMTPEQRMLPNMVPDHSAMASALISLGRLDEAEEAINTAIAIVEKVEKPNADFAPAYANRADIRESRGDLAGAEADYRKALAYDRQVLGGDANLEVPVGLAAVATVLRKQGRLAEADALSAEAVKAMAGMPEGNSRRPAILDTRAATLAAAGRGSEALAVSREASELLAETLVLNRERDPGPMPFELRPILGRRVALLWDAAHP